MLETLKLPDEQLIAALGGRRRGELAALHAAFASAASKSVAICRHDPAYPLALREVGAPCLLHLSCPARFVTLTARPCVTILGTTESSPYGREVASSLARGLAVAGITVVAALRDGIAAAAHEGAGEAESASLALLDHGLGRPAPASLRVLQRRLRDDGLLAAELAGSTHGRRWSARAADRTLAALADAAVLVEDRDQGAAAFALRLAASRGRPTGALPGPVTSCFSTGPHAALAAGARLIRGAEDVLELLAIPPAQAGVPRGPGGRRGLSGRLQGVLDRVGAGHDTPETLSADPKRRGEAMAALAELELRGLVRRTAAGRYVAREPAR